MSQQNFVSYDDATSIVTEVASKIAGKQDVLSFDNSPTQNSDNPVKSGGVYTALASKANTSDIGTAAAKNFTTSVTSGSNDLVTSGAVYTAIDNLPEPMVFKGSLGTGGTITALPVNGTATVGDTYKVITAGTYDSKAAKVGDTFICLTKTSSANTWELIPSGDEPSGTVTSVTLKATSPIAIDSSSAITTSGTRTLSHANSGATAGSYGDSGNQTPGYGSTFKVPYVTVNATGHVTAISEHTVKIPASDNTNTTYTFANGTNGFTVTPSGGSAQTVTVTPNDSTKLPLAGGTLTGAINTANNTYNKIGDDVAIGDINAAGILGIKGLNGNTGIRLVPYSGNTAQTISIDGSGNMSISGNVTIAGTTTATSFSGSIANATGLTKSQVTTALGYTPPASDTNTTYTFANGTNGFTVTPSGGSAQTVTVTPSFTVTTGDANGQVKVNGTNASVKGLGSAAYTSNDNILYKNVDIPEGAANLNTTATAHKITTYRNGFTIPYQMDNANDGGLIRCRGTSESSCIFEMATWDDSGAGETIQFNYYPTTSQITPTYSVEVPKKSGTIALTSDVTNHTNPIFYGTCSTVSTTAAKVATCSKFSGLAEGVTVKIKFTNENYVDNPTLNVNSTGAKAIYKHGYAITRNTNPGWKASDVVSFTYDGTRWNMNDAMDTCLLHVQSMDNNTDTSNLGCSVSGTVGILQGTLRVKTACQDLFTIGVSYRTTDIIGPASGILVNTNSSKSIYTIDGIGNEFTCSSTVPVGTYTVICNFCVKYAYSDLLT